MRSNVFLAVGLIFLLICFFSGEVFAQEAKAIPALWVTKGVDSDDIKALRFALEEETDSELIDVHRAFERLEKISAKNPAAPRSDKLRSLLREAHESYIELRLGQSSKAYEKTIAHLLTNGESVADPEQVARVLFEHSLVRLATHHRENAADLLTTALILDPDLSPDPDVYGPPVFRLIEQTHGEIERSTTVTLRISRFPDDATVLVDGQIVEPGQSVQVLRGKRHLITAERLGFLPQSRFIEATEDLESAIILEPSSEAVLARQILGVFHAQDQAGGADAISDELLALISRALGIPRQIVVTAGQDGEYELLLRQNGDDSLVRTARGGQLPWESYPFQVLAAALDGRVIEAPPPPDQVSISLSAPSSVSASSVFSLRVFLGESADLIEQISARCGRIFRTADHGPFGQSLEFQIHAPDHEGTLACRVRVYGRDGILLAHLPDPENPLIVQVRNEPTQRPWYRRWFVWTSVAGVLAAGIIAGVVLSLSDNEPQNELVIHGPE